MAAPKEKFLDAQVEQELRKVFSELSEPVQLLLFRSGAGCETCDATQQLLEEVAGVSRQLGLQVCDVAADADMAAQFRVDKTPTLIVAGKNGPEVVDLGIRFSGIPSGHEFNTLITDILLVSRRDSGLAQKTRDFLKTLTKPLLLQVFVTPT
jgi:alkyl hydroperoxide reductase subunit AhpF